MRDDGKYALVEFVARDRATVQAILSDRQIGVFREGQTQERRHRARTQEVQEGFRSGCLRDGAAMTRILWVIAGLLLSNPAFAAYQYFLSDNFASIDTSRWTASRYVSEKLYGLTASALPERWVALACRYRWTSELQNARHCPSRRTTEIARNSVESKRPSELIDYATATPFARGFLETALAIADSSIGIWR